jgi:hypothetical protein
VAGREEVHPEELDMALWCIGT